MKRNNPLPSKPGNLGYDTVPLKVFAIIDPLSLYQMAYTLKRKNGVSLERLWYNPIDGRDGR